MLHAIETGKQDVFVVACDPRSGGAFFGGYNTALQKVTADGKVSGFSKPQARSISSSPRAGTIWFANEEGVFQLDQNAEAVNKLRFESPPAQVWLQPGRLLRVNQGVSV